jgi:hypothetical protein
VLAGVVNDGVFAAPDAVVEVNPSLGELDVLRFVEGLRLWGSCIEGRRIVSRYSTSEKRIEL